MSTDLHHVFRGKTFRGLKPGEENLVDTLPIGWVMNDAEMYPVGSDLAHGFSVG